MPGFDAGGNAIMPGTCWVTVEGMDAPVRMNEGGSFLLTRRRAFMITTDLSLPPADASPFYAAAENGIATCNGGGDFF